MKVSFYAHYSVGFSSAHCLAPLIGLFAGASGACMLFGMRTIVQIFTYAKAASILSACHLPTLAAAGYLSLISSQHTTSFYKRLFYALIPLSCIVLFCLQTSQTAACLYATFWFIAMATLCIPHTNLFVHCIGSTFTAHAVGSVLWLYFGPAMTPNMWINLMPLVVLERLLFASGMWISYTLIMVGISRYNTYGATRDERTQKIFNNPIISSDSNDVRIVSRDEAHSSKKA